MRYELPYCINKTGNIRYKLFVHGERGVGVAGILRLRMRYWRYEIREEEIDIQHGIIIIKRTLVPMLRVQHVDTERGPVMRHFGLATLLISTAATEHRIPALSLEKASELQGEISKMARVSDEDV